MILDMIMRIAAGLAIGFVGGYIAARLNRWQVKRQFLRVARAEYLFWAGEAAEGRQYNDHVQRSVASGGEAAAANIIAAAMGRPAPWHECLPRHKQQKEGKRTA